MYIRLKIKEKFKHLFILYFVIEANQKQNRKIDVALGVSMTGEVEGGGLGAPPPENCSWTIPLNLSQVRGNTPFEKLSSNNQFVLAMVNCALLYTFIHITIYCSMSVRVLLIFSYTFHRFTEQSNFLTPSHY